MQTTEHPEPSSRVSARHWALLCAAVGAALPPAKPLRRLLLAHLRYRGTALHAGEEGKFARRAEQVPLSTLTNKLILRNILNQHTVNSRAKSSRGILYSPYKNPQSLTAILFMY